MRLPGRSRSWNCESSEDDLTAEQLLRPTCKTLEAATLRLALEYGRPVRKLHGGAESRHGVVLRSCSEFPVPGASEHLADQS